MNSVFKTSPEFQRGIDWFAGGVENPGARREKSAFTLVELMVAMTVLSLMILFLFSVFDQATRAWQASEKKVDAFREARAALYVIRRDLSGAIIETNLPLNSDLGGNSSSIPIEGQIASTNNLFFVSAQPASSQGSVGPGDLCTVGYYVAWSTNDFQPTNGTTTDGGVSRSFNLFRYFKDSAVTYTNMTTYWASLGSGTNFNTALKFLYPGVSSAPLRGDEVLARNVTGFAVTPYYRNAGVLTATNGAITNYLSYLDVGLTVINYDTAAKLGDTAGNGANWTNGSNASPMVQGLLQKNEQIFYTRIPFKK